MPWTLADVMVSPVITVPQETPYRQLVETLWDHNISGIAVVDGEGKTVGVVSESDLVLREEYPRPEQNRRWLAILRELDGNAPTEAFLARLRKAEAATARDLMTAPAVTISAEATLTQAARLMDSKKVKRLVVVDRDLRPIGVATRSDLLKVFLRGDNAIAADARAIASPGMEVAVHGGVVRITGQVDSRDGENALTERLRAIPGVVRVDTFLVTPVA